MRKTIILALLVVAASAAPEGGWSWGTEEKIETDTDDVVPVDIASGEQGRSFRGQFNRQSASSPEIHATDFVEPLPLEPHNTNNPKFQHTGSNVPPASLNVASEVTTGDANDPDREARFLGMSDALCGWGLFKPCDQKVIKKKGSGYPHAINSQYGVPSTQYDIYDQGHSSYSNTYQQKPKGHKNKKKGGSGVSDLLSGFLNSYTKPKANKGYDVTKLPTYIPPTHGHQAGYGVPVYVAKPVHIHNPPKTYIQPKPSYVPHKPTYAAPKPAYSPPKASYGAHKAANHHHETSFPGSSYISPVITPLKPKYVHTPPKVAVYTHTVAPIQATKVQHLHSHTHVYHGAQVLRPGDVGYSTSVHGSSGGHFQKKSDNEGSILSSTDDSFGSPSSFVSSSSSFGPSPSGSSVNGFLSTPLEASSSSNIHHNENPFNSQKTSDFGGNRNQGFSSHTKFIAGSQSQSNSFQADRFQPSQSEFGFTPSLTIEDMINQKHPFSQFGRTIYRSDCHCISEQYCSRDNIVLGQKDFSNVIDARNRQSDVYSNSTSSGEETEESNTTSESTRKGKSFDFGDSYDEETNNSTDAPDYEYELVTEASPVENITEIIPEVSRRRRDTDQSSDNFSDVQGRQLKGYTPGPHGCGAGTVCCQRPVYSPARALPICGISNDENIHGRIKTKNEDTGRAGFAEYPWQAAILRRSGGEMVYVCGATLISDQYLITAAHCVNNIEASTLKLRLGEWDVRDKTEFYSHVESEVSGIYIHPQFYEGNLENDIAILRVSERVDYPKYPHISPVCLPASGADYTGQVCTITGWGKDGWGSEGEFQAILKETRVPVMDSEICQQVLRGTKLGPSYNLHQGMICAGGEEDKDACKGDGGGPLVCRGSAGEYQLAGVVSWGIGCGERGIPGVYVDVPHYVDWINSITRS